MDDVPLGRSWNVGIHRVDGLVLIRREFLPVAVDEEGRE